MLALSAIPSFTLHTLSIKPYFFLPFPTSQAKQQQQQAMGSLGPSMGMGVTKVTNKLQQKQLEQRVSSCFQMPLHYPRYTRADYETMPEWKLNSLLQEYGLPATGGVDDKRKFAMGAFLWA